MGQLARVDHEGMKLLGIKNPDSISEHVLRSAQIAYILASLERYEKPHEVVSIVVFYSINETRTGNQHRVATRYIDFNEDKVAKEQTDNLGKIGEDIFSLWKQRKYRNTEAGIIAKDADGLGQAFRAKEYSEQGFQYAQDWINNVGKALKTKSAKKLWQELQKTHSNEWWQGLKKFKYIDNK